MSASNAEDPFAEVLAGETVKRRVLEYLGQTGTAGPSCVYLARCDAENPSRIDRHAISELDSLLCDGSSLARSLYDTRSIIAHLDIEAVNHDSPTAAFIDPWRAFQLQEPVVTAIEELLTHWGIRPLHLVTGQGHHFVWQVPRHSSVERRLSHLFPAADPDGSEQVFGNLGLVMEYVAQRIKERSQALSEVPVEITALQVPPGPNGQREMVSIDISEYGDPIDSRTIRIPFTRYLKPWRTGLARRFGVEGEIGHCVTIPLHEMDVPQALKVRQDPADIAQLARRCAVGIPNQIKGTGRLLDDYLSSPLCRFHERYYEARHDPPEQWPRTYGRTPLDSLPNCIRHLLIHPNDALLKPSGIRLVTRCLLAQGWHPRHIAGLVRSKFEDPSHGWGDQWQGYHPGFRADFYVRLFAGQISTGLDRLEDMNCEAEKARGFCHPGAPPCDLDPFRKSIQPC
ncbi:MAG: hypothetical protein KDM64_14515 [Verrucomicrobiae bacterium]|nr:hypothetical protein [Verrucomicrobiae bacterium]